MRVLLRRWQLAAVIFLAVAVLLAAFAGVVAGVDWYFEKLFKRR